MLIHNNELLTPIGNRIGQVCLTKRSRRMAAARFDVRATLHSYTHFTGSTLVILTGQPHGVHQQVPALREPDSGATNGHAIRHESPPANRPFTSPPRLPLKSTLLQIRVLCISPDGSLLMSVDKDGRALLINRRRQVLLHHFSFKGPVACARFSPDGRYLAVGVGRLVQVRGKDGVVSHITPRTHEHTSCPSCPAPSPRLPRSGSPPLWTNR